MKKIALIFVGLILFSCSCKKDEPIKPPNINPPPTDTRMKITGTFDVDIFSLPRDLGMVIIWGRDGCSITSYVSVFSGNYGQKNFSFYLDHSLDSLKGKTYDVAFGFSYNDADFSYSATIIKPITFSDSTAIGKVGFSCFNWYTTPRTSCIVLPDTTRCYY